MTVNPRIAEPDQSMAAAIVDAAKQGWFTSAEAEDLIDRIRATSPRTEPLTPPDNQEVTT
jgi:hypothetical protein